MRVLGQALQAGRGRGSGGGRDRNLVHHDLFAALQDGLPPLSGPGGDGLERPRFGFALGHVRRMVPFGDVAYVIVQPCVGVKDASCVEVCPVDCIHTDDAADMYYIDPDECIDCGACVDPCPVDAIFPEDEVPAQWLDFIKINADYFKK
jgi:NAD-dependent dihydropyrimidine dehydrogenase PreA subunit